MLCRFQALLVQKKFKFDPLEKLMIENCAYKLKYCARVGALRQVRDSAPESQSYRLSKTEDRIEIGCCSRAHFAPKPIPRQIRDAPN